MKERRWAVWILRHESPKIMEKKGSFLGEAKGGGTRRKKKLTEKPLILPKVLNLARFPDLKENLSPILKSKIFFCPDLISMQNLNLILKFSFFIYIRRLYRKNPLTCLVHEKGPNSFLHSIKALPPLLCVFFSFPFSLSFNINPFNVKISVDIDAHVLQV